MARQPYVDYEPRQTRDNRKIKEVLLATKKITKNELKSLIRSTMRQILREELANFLTMDSLIRDTIADEFRKYLATPDFGYRLSRIVDDDIQRIKTTLENIMIKRIDERTQARKKRRPIPADTPRKVKL